jgi:hypothetical protein
MFGKQTGTEKIASNNLKGHYSLLKLIKAW